MSLHIEARQGQIAESVLLPGDPLRAKFIAEHFMEDVKCYNSVRNMNGYTGKYKGKQVSIQGTGMGIPSTLIYVNELISSFNVKKLIRIGTCGSIQDHLRIGDLILAMVACTDSSINKIQFNGLDYAPHADFEFLIRAYELGKSYGYKLNIGNVFSTDTFYDQTNDRWHKWIEHGVLAAEMETSALYTVAAKHKLKALSILTVSDHIINGDASSAEDREQKFLDMAKIALELIASDES